MSLQSPLVLSASLCVRPSFEVTTSHRPRKSTHWTPGLILGSKRHPEGFLQSRSHRWWQCVLPMPLTLSQDQLHGDEDWAMQAFSHSDFSAVAQTNTISRKGNVGWVGRRLLEVIAQCYWLEFSHDRPLAGKHNYRRKDASLMRQ